jgi:hypothetical protein
LGLLAFLALLVFWIVLPPGLTCRQYIYMYINKNIFTYILEKNPILEAFQFYSTVLAKD